MRVLMITQVLDAGHPVLAFVTRWVEALAERVDRLHVICLESAAPALPGNVRVTAIGARGTRGQRARLAAFVGAARRAMLEADVVFSHMSPRFAWAVAPVARRSGCPIVFWYVHQAVSAELRLAVWASARVVTAVPESLPVSTAKRRAIGHGVDAGFFAPAATSARDRPPIIAMVGRLSPIKHQDTLVRALARLGAPHRDARVVFAGTVPDSRDRSYADTLARLAETLGVDRRVTFAGRLAPEAVRDLVRRAAVAVNLSPVGLFDKAAVESLMIGTPTVVAASSFDAVLGAAAARWRVAAPDDVEGLARAIADALWIDEAARERLMAPVRERAIALHGLDGMMDRLVDVFRSAREAR